MGRTHLTLAVVFAILFASLPAIPAQTSSQLEVRLIGNGAGPYYAAAGQVTQLKVEILILGPDDVYLIRGEAYLDPNLTGNWQLTHSENTDNFHLSKLQSAIWTFDLPMPANIEAANSTGGIPQVVLLVQIIYSTSQGQQETASTRFILSVPGAAVRHPEYLILLVLVGISAALFGALLISRIMRRSKSQQKPSLGF